MYGGCPPPCPPPTPILKAWLTWKSGVALNIFVISARSPEKVRLVRKTSRSTSFAMLSMLPGFDKPKASRLS